MDDHYAILGLDKSASREAIKIAYRQLARKTHPDHSSLSSENEKAILSRDMARLNQAFAVLYDVKQRREYDEQLRTDGMLVHKSPAAKSETNADISSSGQRSRMRPRDNIGSNLVSEFSNHLRSTLLGNREKFSWTQKNLEGFDWALEAASWSSRLCVSLRAFTSVDAATTKKFINYSETATVRHKSYLRKTSFLFLLAFQQLEEWESVSAQCQRFVATNGPTKSSSPRGIILLDLQYGRTLRFDTHIRGKQFNQLLDRIGTPT